MTGEKPATLIATSFVVGLRRVPDCCERSVTTGRAGTPFAAGGDGAGLDGTFFVDALGGAGDADADVLPGCVHPYWFAARPNRFWNP